MLKNALLLIASLAAAAVPSAQADDAKYPTHPIKIVVPFSAGALTDTLARVYADQLTKRLGQPVIVENRPGSGGISAMMTMLNAPPDGYTLQMVSSAHTVNPTLFTKLPYDTLKDVSGVALIASSPTVAVVNPKLGVKTLPEFIKLAKASPAKLSYASSGNGSITHLALERLKREAGIDLVHVPYKGTVPAIASVLAGDTALAFGTIPGVVPHAKAGKLVLLGASFGKRFSQIPEVPAIAETVPGYDMGFYTALFAPAKTPKEIVDRLHREVVKAQAQPKVKEIFASSAAEAGTMTPAQLKQYIAAEVKAWGDIVSSVGLKID